MHGLMDVVLSICRWLCGKSFLRDPLQYYCRLIQHIAVDARIALQTSRVEEFHSGGKIQEKNII